VKNLYQITLMGAYGWVLLLSKGIADSTTL